MKKVLIIVTEKIKMRKDLRIKKSIKNGKILIDMILLKRITIQNKR
jgi:hypothetical protein